MHTFFKLLDFSSISKTKKWQNFDSEFLGAHASLKVAPVSESVSESKKV